MEILVLYSIPATIAVQCVLLTTGFLVFWSPYRTKLDVHAPLVDCVGGKSVLDLLLRAKSPRHPPAERVRRGAHGAPSPAPRGTQKHPACDVALRRGYS